MPKKKIYIVVEIGRTLLKILSWDVVNDNLLLAKVKDMSFLKTKEQKRQFIIDALKEAIPPEQFKYAVGILSLPDDASQIKRLNLPQMPISEIPEALKWRVKGLVSFDVNNAVLDFNIVGEFKDEEDAKKTEIIMAAVPRSEIDEQVRLLKESGLDTIGSVNIDTFGLSNVVKLTPEGKKTGLCAILKLGYTGSSFNVYKGGELVFVRNIPIGINQIKDSVKGPVTTDAGTVELTQADIDQLKEAGIPEDRDIFLNGRLEGRHMLALVRPVLESLCNEVSRSLEYYTANMETREIQKLYIVGDGSVYKNLDRFIKDTLSIDTEYLKPPSYTIDPVTQGDMVGIIPQIVSLIGIAKGGVTAKVNLLPVEYRVEKIQQIQKISIRIVSFTAVAILLTSFLFVNIRASDYNRRLLNIKSRRKILQEIKDLYDMTRERKKLIDTVKALGVPSVSIMKELSNVVPQNTVFDQLIIDQKSKKLRIEGTVYLESRVGEVVLTDFMETLEKSPYFKGVNLESSKKGVSEEKKAVLFAINCDIQEVR